MSPIVPTTPKHTSEEVVQSQVLPLSAIAGVFSPTASSSSAVEIIIDGVAYKTSRRCHKDRDLKGNFDDVSANKGRYGVHHGTRFFCIQFGNTVVDECLKDSAVDIRNVNLELHSCGYDADEWLLKKNRGEFNWDYANITSPLDIDAGHR